MFVLEEEAHDRDPAVTLADGVLKAKARTLRPPAEQPPKPRPGRYRWDPLRSMMHRGTARLRHDIAAEDAIRHAALRGRGRAAPHHRRRRANHALALQQAAERPILPLRHGLFVYADTGELVEIDPAPQEDRAPAGAGALSETTCPSRPRTSHDSKAPPPHLPALAAAGASGAAHATQPEGR